MSHYVYFNQKDKKVTIHRGACSFCNDGHGVGEVHDEVGEQNGDKAESEGKAEAPQGDWLGPFPNYTRAKQAARKIRQPNQNNCYFCNP